MSRPGLEREVGGYGRGQRCHRKLSSKAWRPTVLQKAFRLSGSSPCSVDEAELQSEVTRWPHQESWVPAARERTGPLPPRLPGLGSVSKSRAAAPGRGTALALALTPRGTHLGREPRGGLQRHSDNEVMSRVTDKGRHVTERRASGSQEPGDDRVTVADVGVDSICADASGVK